MGKLSSIDQIGARFQSRILIRQILFRMDRIDLFEARLNRRI